MELGHPDSSTSETFQEDCPTLRSFRPRFAAVPALLYLPNGAMASGIFYLLLALCIAGALWFVLALRARIRRRQQSRGMEERIAKCLSQVAAKKKRAGWHHANS
jgi:membrane-bound ClpP family serine protease